MNCKKSIQMIKRTLTFMLSLAMVITSLYVAPMVAQAEEEDVLVEEVTTEEEVTIDEQEPVEEAGEEVVVEEEAEEVEAPAAKTDIIVTIDESKLNNTEYGKLDETAIQKAVTIKDNAGATDEAKLVWDEGKAKNSASVAWKNKTDFASATPSTDTEYVVGYTILTSAGEDTVSDQTLATLAVGSYKLQIEVKYGKTSIIATDAVKSSTAFAIKKASPKEMTFKYTIDSGEKTVTIGDAVDGKYAVDIYKTYDDALSTAQTIEITKIEAQVDSAKVEATNGDGSTVAVGSGNEVLTGNATISQSSGVLGISVGTKATVAAGKAGSVAVDMTFANYENITINVVADVKDAADKGKVVVDWSKVDDLMYDAVGMTKTTVKDFVAVDVQKSNTTQSLVDNSGSSKLAYYDGDTPSADTKFNAKVTFLKAKNDSVAEDSVADSDYEALAADAYPVDAGQYLAKVEVYPLGSGAWETTALGFKGTETGKKAFKIVPFDLSGLVSDDEATAGKKLLVATYQADPLGKKGLAYAAKEGRSGLVYNGEKFNVANIKTVGINKTLTAVSGCANSTLKSEIEALALGAQFKVDETTKLTGLNALIATDANKYTNATATTVDSDGNITGFTNAPTFPVVLYSSGSKKVTNYVVSKPKDNSIEFDIAKAAATVHNLEINVVDSSAIVSSGATSASVALKNDTSDKSRTLIATVEKDGKIEKVDVTGTLGTYTATDFLDIAEESAPAIATYGGTTTFSWNYASTVSTTAPAAASLSVPMKLTFDNYEDLTFTFSFTVPPATPVTPPAERTASTTVALGGDLGADITNGSVGYLGQAISADNVTLTGKNGEPLKGTYTPVFYYQIATGVWKELGEDNGPMAITSGSDYKVRFDITADEKYKEFDGKDSDGNQKYKETDTEIAKDTYFEKTFKIIKQTVITATGDAVTGITLSDLYPEEGASIDTSIFAGALRYGKVGAILTKDDITVTAAAGLKEYQWRNDSKKVKPAADGDLIDLTGNGLNAKWNTDQPTVTIAGKTNELGGSVVALIDIERTTAATEVVNTIRKHTVTFRYYKFYEPDENGDTADPTPLTLTQDVQTGKKATDPRIRDVERWLTSAGKVWDFDNDIVNSSFDLYAAYAEDISKDNRFKLLGIDGAVYNGNKITPVINVLDTTTDTILPKSKIKVVIDKTNKNSATDAGTYNVTVTVKKQKGMTAAIDLKGTFVISTYGIGDDNVTLSKPVTLSEKRGGGYNEKSFKPVASFKIGKKSFKYGQYKVEAGYWDGDTYKTIKADDKGAIKVSAPGYYNIYVKAGDNKSLTYDDPDDGSCIGSVTVATKDSLVSNATVSKYEKTAALPDAGVQDIHQASFNVKIGKQQATVAWDAAKADYVITDVGTGKLSKYLSIRDSWGGGDTAYLYISDNGADVAKDDIPLYGSKEIAFKVKAKDAAHKLTKSGLLKSLPKSASYTGEGINVEDVLMLSDSTTYKAANVDYEIVKSLGFVAPGKTELTQANFTRLQDYVTITYEKNIKAGTAKVTVIARENYCGKQGKFTTTFKIDKADISKALGIGADSASVVASPDLVAKMDGTPAALAGFEIGASKLDLNKAGTSYASVKSSVLNKLISNVKADKCLGKNDMTAKLTGKKKKTDTGALNLVLTGKGNYKGKITIPVDRTK